MANGSPIEAWPLRLVVVDVAWGGFLKAAATPFAAWCEAGSYGGFEERERWFLREPRWSPASLGQ